MASQVIPVDIPPGYVKVDSPLTERGRYTDGFGVRFFKKKAQKTGGFAHLLSSSLGGIVRGLKAWNDLSSQQLIAAGTTQRLYAISDRNFIPVDITPFVRTIYPTDPFSTTAGSAIVNVHFPSHLATVGQILFVSGATSVAGILVDGYYAITAIVDNDNFTITASNNATGGGSGAGGFSSGFSSGFQLTLTDPSGHTGGGSPTLSLELANGIVDPVLAFGYGASTFGTGTWGTIRGASAILLYPRFWSLGNFGKLLLSSPSDNTLFVYDPTDATKPRAVPVATAPTIMSGFFITAERFVIAYGINNNLMQFQWCGQGDYTDWDASAETGALGAPSRIRNVQIGKRIMGGTDIGGFVSLIWTDSAVYSHQYTGSSNVFNTLLLGKDCGLIGPNAYAVVGSTAFWMSSGGMFMSQGGSPVQKMPNFDDVSEWFFNNLRPNYSLKSFAWYNPRFGEVWFAFPDLNNTEPNLCLVYNIAEQFWFTDTLSRTAATRFDGSDARPILAAPSGMLYQHEQGVDADGVALPWSLSTALFELENGQVSVGIDSYYPDMERQTGTVNMTITAYDRTPKPSIETGTNSFGPTDDMVDFRIAGRELSLTMAGGTATGDDFRLGSPKVEYTVSGRRVRK